MARPIPASGRPALAAPSASRSAGRRQSRATINVRYKPAWENETSELLTRRFMRSHTRSSFDAASDTFRLAVAAAEFAEILRNSENADAAGLEQVRAILMDMEIGGDARTEMITLVETAASLMGM